MKVKIGGVQKDILTVWMEKTSVYMIDQNLLPYQFRILQAEDYRRTCQAIRYMTVRGAGAIAVAAAFGLVQAAVESRGENIRTFRAKLEDASAEFRQSRPTAANLGHAIDRCLRVLDHPRNVKSALRALRTEAERISQEDIRASARIGELGNNLINDGDGILTHCNAGALAFVDHGTALSLVRAAHRSNKKIEVYVDETRPRSQGARLTAWELQQEGIPYAIIVDGAAGHFMRQGRIQIVLVGADRIARNGDMANKVGTYQLAVLARENKIPFYVAAPTATFDPSMTGGEEIPIEERDRDEVTWVSGVDREGRLGRVRIAPEGARAFNPAFDVTPGSLVSGFITEKGIITPPFPENISATLGEEERNV